MALLHSWSSITFCQLIWRNPSLSDLLGMPGPPKFESKGDRRTDPSLQLSIVPRERTHETPGVAASSGPVRLTPGPCATLPTGLTEDPLVARICTFQIQRTCHYVHRQQGHDCSGKKFFDQHITSWYGIATWKPRRFYFRVSFHVPTLTIKTSWHSAVLPSRKEEH